jgi:hypothetical protein
MTEHKAFVVNTESGEVRKVPESSIGCDTCGHLACVCDTLREHKDGCQYRLAVTCAVGIECKHGYDVCPECDPCTCDEA